MNKTIYIKLNKDAPDLGYVDMSIELVDTLVDQGVEDIVFTHDTGRWFSTVDEWVDEEPFEVAGVPDEMEGKWLKRIKLSRMVKA